VTAEPLAAIARRCGVTRGTVWRWITAGVAVGPRRVRLAAVRVGGRWMVPADSWSAFDAACNPDPGPTPEAPTAAARRATAARALALKLTGAT
jgi:hypothetical protein